MGGRKDIFRQWLGTSFDAKQWLSLDPCGCAGITLSWSVHLYALTVLAWKCTSHSMAAQVIYVFLYLPFALLAMISLFKASTTDPGAVPLGARPFTTVKRAVSGEISPSNHGGRRSIRRCHKCLDNYKPARAHHDSVTGRCIVKFDHFCPWVNKYVPKQNRTTLIISHSCLHLLLASQSIHFLSGFSNHSSAARLAP